MTVKLFYVLPVLSPGQLKSFDAIAEVSKLKNILHLWARPGLGQTTILRHLQQKLDAHFIGMREFVATQRGQHPLAIEDSLFELIDQNVDRKSR